MSRGIDVLAVMRRSFDSAVADGFYEGAADLCNARAALTELLAAAHASLEARDLSDQVAADDRLRAALAACEPTDTDHNHEAINGLCAEELPDEL